MQNTRTTLYLFWTYALLGYLLLLASPTLAADTIIFTEGCASNPTDVSLTLSSNVTVGISWGALVTLFGTAATTINSAAGGTTNCSAAADSTDDGLGYIMNPNPRTNHYYVDFLWIDGGAVPVTSNQGALLNYIDTNNYYACTFHDDATPEVVVYKIKAGIGSRVAATSTNQTISSTNQVECRINYTGSQPVFTVTNVTTATQLFSATDTTDPLPRNSSAGFMCGAMPDIGEGFDCESLLDADTIRLTEVSLEAGKPRVLHMGTLLLLKGKLLIL